MSPLGQRIANLVLSTYHNLPQKCQPRIFSDGSREWTPLSAVVLAKDANSEHEVLTCASLATGTKCLPVNSLPEACGSIIHDYHAEILALRGLSQFLLSEAKSLLSRSIYDTTTSSAFLEPTWSGFPYPSQHSPPFRLRSVITVHLFTTTAPCGSASLNILIDSKANDNQPWALPIPQAVSSDSGSPLTLQHGHANFHPTLLSSVRTKPSRPDAPLTLSKSCSDKLTLSQFTGILRFPADLFLQPVFVDNVIVPQSGYHEEGWKRAFSTEGRIGSSAIERQGSFFTTDVLNDRAIGSEFARTPGENGNGNGEKTQSRKVSNISALYIGATFDGHHVGHGHVEVVESLVNGVKQGFRQDSSHSGKESVICRKRMWGLGRQVLEVLRREMERNGSNLDGGMVRRIGEALGRETYSEAKRCGERRERRELKKHVTDRLGGWAANDGDELWSLMVEG